MADSLETLLKEAEKKNKIRNLLQTPTHPALARQVTSAPELTLSRLNSTPCITSKEEDLKDIMYELEMLNKPIQWVPGETPKLEANQNQDLLYKIPIPPVSPLRNSQKQLFKSTNSSTTFSRLPKKPLEPKIPLLPSPRLRRLVVPASKEILFQKKSCHI